MGTLMNGKMPNGNVSESEINQLWNFVNEILYNGFRAMSSAGVCILHRIVKMQNDASPHYGEHC